MTNQINNTILLRFSLALFTLAFSFQLANSQAIQGPTTVTAGSTHTYTWDDGNVYPYSGFENTGGTELSDGITGTQYYTSIQWGSAGTGEVRLRRKTYPLITLTVTINGAGPGVPDMPSITNYTGYTVLTRGTPPSGETWYWQSSSTGTSTLNSSNSITMTSGTVYYLRSQDNTSGDWGGARTVNYTVTGVSTILVDENFIHTTTPRVETTDVSSLTYDQVIENVTYYDGLGRAVQEVAIRAGVNNQDIISHIDYDALGRKAKQYLPYASSAGIGSYRPNAVADINSFYMTTKYENTSNHYGESHFEPSPLNRVIEQTAPGTSWELGTNFDSNGHSDGHTIKSRYDTNSLINEVRYYTVSLSASYVPTLNSTGYYPNATLIKTIVKNENWVSADGQNNTIEEFKDKLGRVVLERAYESGQKHDTYYVYDDYGNLTFVLPPLSEPTATVPNGTTLADLCYEYRYDRRNRLTSKRIPGKDWEYIVYDNLNRPVMTQDGLQRAKSPDEWTFTKYDGLGRVAYTGIYSSNSSQSSIQSTFDAKSEQDNFETKASSGTGYDGTYYTNNDFPSTSIEVLTVNYYDDYNFNREGTGTSVSSYTVNSITNPKSLPTGTRIKVLGESSNNWIADVLYYDDKGRVIYTYSRNNYLDATDIVKSQYNFVDLLETTSEHTKGTNPTIPIIDKFSYDNAGRLVSHVQEIDSQGEELIISNKYDELGQLESKDVGNSFSTPLQTIDYTYNVRGWLRKINNPGNLGTDLFALNIHYDNPSHGSATDLFNGNISQVNWKSANTNSSDFYYLYEYDDLNRITKAQFAGGGWWSRYNLYDVTYDKNGNILTLKRNGHRDSQTTLFGTMDNLNYIYVGNQLFKLTDHSGITMGFNDGANTATEYTYDVNGNMITDQNKGITAISYNHLNLPEKVVFNNNDPAFSTTWEAIEYTYNAMGAKLEKRVKQGSPGNYNTTTTQYVGSHIYEDGNLKFFDQPEGFVEPNGSDFDYVYQYTDHLGNVRLTYKDLNQHTSVPVSLEIQEENNFHPFGLKHKGYNDNVSANANPVAGKFKYNGKELEEAHGYGMYEMDLRSYDPAMARWTSIDPVTHHSLSTYNAFDNNPAFFADPSGADGVWPIFNPEDIEKPDDPSNGASGAMIMWRPQINDDGSISYIAEEGDSASSLSSQYDLSQEVAEEITGTSGDTEIEEGTEVSGETVNNVTGSPILKLDLSSKEATDQRVIDHFIFAMGHSSSTGASGWLSTNYFNNVFGMLQLPKDYSGTINLNGNVVRVNLNLQWYTSTGSWLQGNTQYHPAIFGNELIKSVQTTGSMFGKNQSITHSRLLFGFLFPEPKGPVWQGHGGVDFTVTSSNSQSLNSTIFRKRPHYQYLRQTQFKN